MIVGDLVEKLARGERLDTAEIASLRVELNRMQNPDLGADIPTNLIAHTTDTSAPSGWAEYTAGRGRVIVGTPSGGTHAGTVGTALTNLQDPTHTHTGPSHSHSAGGTADAAYPGNGLSWYSGAASSASGTGATGATSATMPYVQLLGIQKSA